MTKQFIIIGAGISGLVLAWYLKKRFGDTHSIKLLESSDRAGGWIRSRHHEGYLFESGPRSCRTRGAGVSTLELAEELGIADKVISASPSSKTRFLYSGGALHKVPDTLFSFLTSPLTRGIFPALLKDFCSKRGGGNDESIAEFIGRRFSPEIASRLVDPLVSGIYAGDIRRLSMRSCFPDIYRLEREHGSIVKGMLFQKKTANAVVSPFVESMLKEPIFSFKGGMESLVDALRSRLTQELVFSCPVTGLSLRPDGIEVKSKDGTVWHADKVFVATPYDTAADLLAPLGVSDASPMHSASVAVVNLGWRENVLSREGFGYLVPSCENESILGVVFDSSAFSLQNAWPGQTRLTVMMGGAHHPEIQKMKENQVVEIACDALKRHLGVKAPPDAIHITFARRAIPQYEVGHLAKISAIKTAVSQASADRITLLGSAWHGVSVNDCIANAKRLANNSLLQRIAF